MMDDQDILQRLLQRAYTDDAVIPWAKEQYEKLVLRFPEDGAVLEYPLNDLDEKEEKALRNLSAEGYVAQTLRYHGPDRGHILHVNLRGKKFLDFANGQTTPVVVGMQDSGERETFSTGAVRDTAEGKPRPDLFSPFAMERIGKWLEQPVSENGTFDGDWKRLINAVESEYDKAGLSRYQGFIYAATKLAERLSEFPEVERIALFGSLAKPPYRVPYRYKKRIWAFHEPKDIDLAIWLSSMENLGAMRRVMATLVQEVRKKAPGICEGAMELFVFDSRSSKYLGRVCHLRQCPRGDIDCMVKGCGKPSHLKINNGFILYPDAVSRINSQILFERQPSVVVPATNLLVDLPKRLPEELVEKLVDSKDIRIERIVSTGHVSPPGFWYDQTENEWIVVLQGEATLEFKDKMQHLTSGDCVLIPAHRKHRVSSTSLKEPTVWLAVFFGGETEKKKKATKKAVKKKTT